MKKTILLALLGCLLAVGVLEAYQAEVLDVSGAARLNTTSGVSKPVEKGDLISSGDQIETGETSQVDVAFDSAWNNVVRVESSTSMLVSQPFPTKIMVQRGSLYAKLKQLPSGSEFEVHTPTAVASARGTEFRTQFNGSESSILNFSDSPVSVFGVSSGQRDASPTILTQGKKIRLSPGSASVKMDTMVALEKMDGKALAQGIDQAVNQAISEGRTGQIASVDELEKQIKEELTTQEDKEDEWDDLNVPEFSADMVLSGAQGHFAARLYTASGKSRMEMQGSTSIVRLDRGIVYVLMDADKMYIEQLVSPEMAAQATTGDASIVSRKEVGAEKVNGRDAKKYEVVLSSQGENQTVYQWMAKGVPVPVKMQALDGSWSVEYQNVQVGPQPDSLFELPEGFQKMEMPTLPQDASQLAVFQQAGEQQSKNNPN